MTLPKLLKSPPRIFPTTLVFCLTLLGSLILSSNPASANELSDQFTISLWVKPETSIATKALVAKAEEIRLVTDGSGNPLCQIKATSWQTAVTSSTAITVNNWSHVTCVYDKATLRIFVNGVQTGSQALTVTVDSTGNVFKLGEDDSSGTTYGDLAGVVDNFLAYNYVRTTQQIVEDMNAGHPPPGSPVGSPLVHYKFDEGNGTTANNAGSGGSTLNGTLTSMASPATATSGWSNNGKFDKALSFDGSDDGVIVNTAVTSTLSDWTLSAWIYPKNYNQYGTIVYNGNDSGGYGLMLYNYSGNVRVLYGGVIWLDSGYTLPSLNTWYHILAKRDSSGTLSFYINGVKTPNTYTNTPNAPQPKFSVGMHYNSSNIPSRFFNGTIDEVKIYTSALTDDQVKAEYNMGKATVLGSLSTNATGVASNANDRSYCPPGDSTGSCGPVAEWKFDENTGTTTVNDTSGNANHGTMNGGMTNANWVPGKVGSALSFDGVDDYIEIASPTGIPTAANPWSISLWINADDMGADVPWQRVLLSWGTHNNNNFSSRILVSDDSISWESYNVNGGGSRYTIPGGLVNKWSHLTYSFDGTNVRAYYNGQNVWSYSAPSLNIASSVVRIGKPWGGSYKGKVDHISVYNYTRTPAQIAWDYNRGKPVAHYKLDECSGSTIHSTNDPYNSALNGTWSGSGGSQTSAGDCSTANTAWGNGATGKLNASINFDGTDDYIDAGSSNDIDDLPSKSSLSVSAWIKTPSSWNLPSPTQQSVFVGKNSNTSNGWQLYNQYNGKPTFLVNYTTDGVARSSSVLATNTWYHLVGVFDSSSGNTRLFINGIEANYQGSNGLQQNAVGTYASDASYNLNIARGGAGGADSFFSGQIDDVQIFNYALTPQQIQTIMNSGAIRYGQ